MLVPAFLPDGQVKVAFSEKPVGDTGGDMDLHGHFLRQGNKGGSRQRGPRREFRNREGYGDDVNNATDDADQHEQQDALVPELDGKQLPGFPRIKLAGGFVLLQAVFGQA